MMSGMRKGNCVGRRYGVLVWLFVLAVFVFAGCGGQSESGGSMADTAAGGAPDAESSSDAAAGEAPDVESSSDAAVGGGAGAESLSDAAEAGEEGRTGAPENGEGQDKAESRTGADTAENASGKEVGDAQRGEAEAGNGKAGRKLSILGDSISTFDGWIPEGYACYFPMNGDVMNVEQTWWKMVLKNTKMELCVNGSSAGCTCIGDSLSVDNVAYGCSEGRIWDLIGQNGAFPDVIIVYLGTNDFLKAVPLGDNDGTVAVEEGMIENFSDAYCMILDKLIAYYPNAEIFCCNLPPMGIWGPELGPLFVPFINSLELTPEDYGKQIEVIAASKGCKVIDLQNCGITMENLADYVSDGVHMNTEGMEMIWKAVEAAL